ncbi:MAG: hypothetical protein EHM93_04735 [Bacteroidales bacterium]|nr:MAG: hypothetical protein EHM93_04735 [Bacteroidales bacterium]
MQAKVLRLFILLAVVFQSSILVAQDISTIFEQKPFTFSGSLNLNQMATYRNVSYSSENPYTFFANGNATFTFYGISAPFNFSYSNQQTNYSHPFNFNHFGMQPSWKWIKTYIGFNSMTFSPYSLNGHQFLGGGVELTPPGLGLRFSAMYGRLIKAVEWQPDNPSFPPYYQRLGYAAKVGYSGKSGDYEVTIFKAFDKKNSIDPVPDSLGIAPQENMVYTVKLGKTIIEKVKLSGTYAGSALTRDTKQTDNAEQVKSREFFLINPNATTSYSYALKGSADYLGTGYTVGVAYERIQPNYSTLGAYYNNNDMENIALTFSKQLMQGKLNVSGSGGKQRNNLDKSKVSTSNQFLGNLNIAYAPSQRVNVSTSYSNYSFFTHMKTPFEQINTTNPYQNIDTLNFVQISHSASVNTSYVLGALDSKHSKKIVMVNLSYQQSANRQEGVGVLNSSYFYQGNVAYSYSILPINMSLTTSFMGVYSYMPSVQRQLMAGPVFGVGKSFFDKKLTTSTSLAYNFSTKDGDFTGGVYSIRFGGGYSYQKAHRLNFSFAFIYKDNRMDIIKPKSYEFTGNIGYTYSFDQNR